VGPQREASAGQVTAPAASIVIRTKDEAASIGRLLDLLAGQRVEGAVETIVVDSGSRDGTPELARGRVDRLIEIPAAAFTFGRALNLGAEAASAPVIVALSAHAFPLDDGWLARMIACFDDERVACAGGAIAGPDHAPAAARIVQDLALARTNPFWGYSNAAGGFRTDLWRQRPFLEHLPGTEDKEWAWHWLGRGKVAVLDPALVVDHDHSRDPPLDCYRRAKREWEGYAAYLDLEPLTALDVVRKFWTDQGPHPSLWSARRDPWRAARLVGQWAGRRGARAQSRVSRAESSPDPSR
jgi:rhamnosyltransferase